MRNATYFFWPFNLDMGGATLKYATAQPICHMTEERTTTYFFFEDDQISAEYLIAADGVKNVSVEGGRCTKERNAYFVDGLHPGKQCAINIEKNDGSTVRIVTLDADESNQIWKGTFRGHEFVALSSDALVYDNDHMTLISENPSAEIWTYEVSATQALPGPCETRMRISYEGDVANAYVNGLLVDDSFYDGTPWTLSLSRMPESIETSPMVVRISGLKSADAPIYFERDVKPENCVMPKINSISANREHRFAIH